MKEEEASPEEYRKAQEGMEDDYVTLATLNEMLSSDNPPVVIDLRETLEPSDQKIEGSINITMQNLVIENVEKAIAKKSTPIVLVCTQSFEMTRMVALTTYAYPTLKLMGYSSVKILSNWPECLLESD